MSVPAASTAINTQRFFKWHHTVLRICLIVFASELGYCLVRLPWLSNWDMSYIPMHSPKLSDLWMSHYFRGALSGLGLLNLWVALTELGRLIRGRNRKVEPPVQS